MEEILEAVSGRSGISPEDILSRRRDGKTAEARAVFMYVSSVSGHSNAEIAAFVRRTQSDVSSQIKKISVQKRIYKSLSKEIEDISRVVGGR
jgi:chromosomal replication initiation ATPase DnaA